MKLGDIVKYCSKDGMTGVTIKTDGVVTKIDGNLIHVKVHDLPPITVVVHEYNTPGVSQDWIEQ